MGVLSCKVIYSPKIITRNKHRVQCILICYSRLECFAIYLRSCIVELKKTASDFHCHSLSKSLSYEKFHRQFYILLVNVLLQETDTRETLLLLQFLLITSCIVFQYSVCKRWTSLKCSVVSGRKYCCKFKMPLLISLPIVTHSINLSILGSSSMLRTIVHSEEKKPNGKKWKNFDSTLLSLLGKAKIHFRTDFFS